MTTVKLNKDIISKLSVLIEMEKSTKSEIIKKAIIEYYNLHVKGKNSYEIGKDFFGKYGSEKDTSTAIKEK